MSGPVRGCFPRLIKVWSDIIAVCEVEIRELHSVKEKRILGWQVAAAQLLF